MAAPVDAQLHIGRDFAERLVRLGVSFTSRWFSSSSARRSFGQRLCYGITPAWPIDAAPRAFSNASSLLKKPSARRLSAILLRQLLYLA